MGNRRDFLKSVARHSGLIALFPLVGCGRQRVSQSPLGRLFATFDEVTLYDMYAMALYYDGGLGPKTGVIKVQYILDSVEVTMDFWHGHGGKPHRYKLTPGIYEDLKRLKKVSLETTVVDGHSHKLFIDPKDPQWRVPGAAPITVPL